jgi:hypothetical protein
MDGPFLVSTPLFLERIVAARGGEAIAICRDERGDARDENATDSPGFSVSQGDTIASRIVIPDST